MTQTPFRLVAADLDGTLLDPRGALSSRTIAAVHALREADITVALATSRRLTSTAPVAAALGLQGPLIIYDGAQIRDYPSGGSIASHPLDQRIARRVIEILLAHQLRPVVQYGSADGHGPHGEHGEHGEHMVVGPAMPGSTLDENYLSQYTRQITVVSEAELYQRLAQSLRIVVFDALERLQAAIAEVAALPMGWQLLPRGNYGTAELSVFSPAASKGNALQTLAQRLEIPLTQVFAIGDGINDISMLSVAGLSAAMGNADRVVREAARAVVPANSEDGAAQAIEEYVLGEKCNTARS